MYVTFKGNTQESLSGFDGYLFSGQIKSFGAGNFTTRKFNISVAYCMGAPEIVRLFT